MNVLVTGGAGFIGCRLATELGIRGHQVRVLDNLSTGRKEAVPDGVDFHIGDLCNSDEVLTACTDIEVVFHQAAIRSVPKSIEEPMVSQAVNIGGTLNLLMAAASAGVRRVVYASSSSVYGDVGDQINREDLPTNPMSPYAVSKLAAEKYCQVWSYLGHVEAVSLRYFNVFGPGQHPDSKYSAVFPAFVSALMNGKSPEVHWDGEQSRDFTYVDDVVEANLLAATRPQLTGETLNIASGRPKTINDVLEAIGKNFDSPPSPILLPKRKGDVRRTHADIEKAARLLEWAPRTQWETAVERTVEWFRNQAVPTSRR